MNNPNEVGNGSYIIISGIKLCHCILGMISHMPDDGFALFVGQIQMPTPQTTVRLQTMRITMIIMFRMIRATIVIHDILIHLTNIMKKAAKDNAIHTEGQLLA